MENIKNRLNLRILATLGFGLLSFGLYAADRFPRPEFDNNHIIPTAEIPQPPSDIFHLIDLAVFILAIGLVTFFILKMRSRKGVFLTLLFSLLYFGFYKMGCICAVGSVQNVTLALFDSSYSISWVIFAIFAIPLIFTLFFGRTFCSSVCPLGAIQDVFIIKPLKIPGWLEHLLGLIPYFYLGAAVLFAATQSPFLICRYDPFVGFFRLSAPLEMAIAGAVILFIGVFIGRPYCRYLCPYGVLLRFASLFSKKHMTITPDECIKCRLCENSCPFGAIKKPAPGKLPEARKTGVKRLTKLFMIAPLIIIASAWGGRMIGPYLAKGNPKVAIAGQAIEEHKGAVPPLYSEIISKAVKVEQDFLFGGTLLGIFIGLVIAGKLISLSIYPAGDDYRPDKMKCLSCGRCMPYCPVTKKNTKHGA